LVSKDGIDGVGNRYSSFVPSHRDTKSNYFTKSYKLIRGSRRATSPPPKFAIRSIFVRRTTNKQATALAICGLPARMLKLVHCFDILVSMTRIPNQN
jgi:hypothetical protein